MSGSNSNNIVSNFGPGTYGPFFLNSIHGALAVVMTGTGSVTLNVIGPDGSTPIAVLPGFTTNGFATIDLPAGDYQIVVIGATGVYVSMSVTV